jgi:hypothetical protein
MSGQVQLLESLKNTIENAIATLAFSTPFDARVSKALYEYLMGISAEISAIQIGYSNVDMWPQIPRNDDKDKIMVRFTPLFDNDNRVMKCYEYIDGFTDQSEVDILNFARVDVIDPPKENVGEPLLSALKWRYWLLDEAKATIAKSTILLVNDFNKLLVSWILLQTIVEEDPCPQMTNWLRLYREQNYDSVKRTVYQNKLANEIIKKHYLNLEMIGSTANSRNQKIFMDSILNSLKEMARAESAIKSHENAQKEVETALEAYGWGILDKNNGRQVAEMCIRNVRLGRNIFYVNPDAQPEYVKIFKELREATENHMDLSNLQIKG